MKFTIIKSCLARFSGIFALGTPSNIHGTAISYHCEKFGAFVNSVTILTLRALTIRTVVRQKYFGFPKKKLIYSRLSRILFSVTHTQTTFQLFTEASTSLVLHLA